MKNCGKIRLLIRPQEQFCYSAGCKSPDDCWVIDTYKERSQYLGSWFIHVQDRKEALKVLRKERRWWRADGFVVVR